MEKEEANECKTIWHADQQAKLMNYLEGMLGGTDSICSIGTI